MNLKTKVKAAIRKNYPELKTLLLRRYPPFMYWGKMGSAQSTIPVFAFHDVDHSVFEKQLIYIKENGYKTIDCHELMEYLRSDGDGYDNRIVLTFDDGHITLWEKVFPLLKKYNCKIVSFICPGLIPEENNSGKGKRILCNWKEIIDMHASGLVDFQSHSLYHDLVYSSSRLIDFYGPDYSSHYMGKQDRMTVIKNRNSISLTNLRAYEDDDHVSDMYGLPIFELSPRLAAGRIFSLSEKVKDKLISFVMDNQGHSFFQKRGWEKRLKTEFAKFSVSETGHYLDFSDYRNEIIHDLLRSKKTIEGKLKNKKVEHLCFPWYEAEKKVLEMAFDCGYHTAFLGVEAFSQPSCNDKMQPIKILPRLSDKCLLRLPGNSG